MSRTPTSKKSRHQEAPQSGPALPDYMQNIIINYSGNTTASQSSVIQNLQEDFRGHPTGDLISIVRRQGVNGRQGGVEVAICRECKYQNTFQKVVEHITSSHWGLQLWTCTVGNCSQAYRRKHDLDRHLWDSHEVQTNRASRRGQLAVDSASAPTEPGPFRNPHANSSRQSEPYPTGLRRSSVSRNGRPSVSPTTPRHPLPNEQRPPLVSAPPGTVMFPIGPGHVPYWNHGGGVTGSQPGPSTSAYGFPSGGQGGSRHSGRTARHGASTQQMFDGPYDPSSFLFAPHGQPPPTAAANPYMGQGVSGMQPSTSAGFNSKGGYTSLHFPPSWQDNDDNHSPGF